MTITPRILGDDELERLRAVGGPLAELGAYDTEALKQMAVCVVEADGRIVAYWIAWYALHAEPLWIDPSWRRHPGVVRGIVEQMEALIGASGEPSAFCVVHDTDLAQVVPYARRLGFTEAPGKLYYLVWQAAAPATADTVPATLGAAGG